ncbi:MAG: glutaminyl-peptide cyclotransferase [Dehalococcoidia bacterium]|jgi:glutamine cyclotransferase
MKTPYAALLALFPVLLVNAVAGGDCHSSKTSSPTPEGRVELLESIPHADNAWTEGLLVSDGVLWESTGLKGKSQVRALDEKTGAVLWSVPNNEGFFGEGLVRAFGKTYLLTYMEGEAFLFDRTAANPYSLLAHYDGEGWGLTATDKWLVNSNGSSTLFYRDPQSFAIVKQVSISFGGEPIEKLNELEFDGTYIWANQWETSYIYRIREDDPSQVVRFTLPPEMCPGGTPNGIAWDKDENVFFLTGQSCPLIWKARFH